MQQISILDLGTNTFNLLVIEVDNCNYRILLNTKEGVKLGSGGIHKKIITNEAMQRGFDAISKHYDRMKPFHVSKVIAFGTSAIRDAANSDFFISELKKRFDLEIIVIDGNREAELIYKGVIQTLPFKDKRFVILDIGGGSNEFIIATDNEILWKQSYQLGMARLMERFKPNDPITTDEILTIEKYLDDELTSLFQKVNELKPEIFVGASGSFDSFVKILNEEKILKNKIDDVACYFPMENFRYLYQKIVESSYQERDNMKGLEPVRRDMIVLAAIFVNFVLNKLKIGTMYQSSYSLKEGVAFEIAQKNQFI